VSRGFAHTGGTNRRLGPTDMLLHRGDRFTIIAADRRRARQVVEAFRSDALVRAG
jgi:hypothetical protein